MEDTADSGERRHPQTLCEVVEVAEKEEVMGSKSDEILELEMTCPYCATPMPAAVIFNAGPSTHTCPACGEEFEVEVRQVVRRK